VTSRRSELDSHIKGWGWDNVSNSSTSTTSNFLALSPRNERVSEEKAFRSLENSWEFLWRGRDGEEIKRNVGVYVIGVLIRTFTWWENSVV